MMCLCVYIQHVCVHMFVCIHVRVCAYLGGSAPAPGWSSVFRGQAASLCFADSFQHFASGISSELKPYIFFLFMSLTKSFSNHCSLPPKGVLGSGN